MAARSLKVPALAPRVVAVACGRWWARWLLHLNAGVHEMSVHSDPAGAHVETTESFAGASAEADVAGMQRVLDGSLTSWLSHLKNAAEAAGSTRRWR